MAKIVYQSNPRVAQIFEDLENYLEFCKDFGYRYDEATLYDMRDYAYRQFQKAVTGKFPRNCWVENARPQ